MSLTFRTCVPQHFGLHFSQAQSMQSQKSKDYLLTPQGFNRALRSSLNNPVGC